MKNIGTENTERERISFIVRGHSFHLKVANAAKASEIFAFLNSLLNEKLVKQPGLSLLEALFLVSMNLIQEEEMKREQISTHSCTLLPEETIQGLLSLLVEANEKFKKDLRFN